MEGYRQPYKSLREVFPSRNVFYFDSGIKIASDFDAGNLMNCSEIKEESNMRYKYIPEQYVA